MVEALLGPPPVVHLAAPPPARHAARNRRYLVSTRFFDGKRSTLTDHRAAIVNANTIELNTIP